MVRILEDIGTDRILINSACDWGVSDPLKVAKTVAAMQEAGLRRGRHRQGRLAQPARVLRPERAADPRRPRRARPGRDVRGQHAAARRALSGAAAPPRRQPPAPRVLLQRPPGRRPRRRRRPARALRRARARARSASPVLGVGLWVAAPALADAARGRPAARAARPARARGRDAQRLPVPGVPRGRSSSSTSTARTGPTDARRDYTLGARAAARAAAARRRRRGLDLDAAARLAHGVGRGADAAAGRRALEEVADGPRRAASDDTGKRSGSRSSPSPAARSRRSRRPRRSSPGSRPSGSGCASTPATSRCSSRTPDGALAQLARRGRAGGQGAGVERAARARAGERRRARVPGRRSPSRASCTRCASASTAASPASDDLPEALARRRCPREREWRVHFHVPGPRRRAHDAGRAARRRSPRSRAARRRVTRHLEVETYTWGVLPDGPGGDDGLVEGLAAELAWTRDRLVALGAEEIR